MSLKLTEDNYLNEINLICQFRVFSLDDGGDSDAED